MEEPAPTPVPTPVPTPAPTLMTQSFGQGYCIDSNGGTYPYLSIKGPVSVDNCEDYCRQIGPELCLGYVGFFGKSYCDLQLPSCAGQDTMITLASTDGGSINVPNGLRGCNSRPGPIAKSTGSCSFTGTRWDECTS